MRRRFLGSEKPAIQSIADLLLEDLALGRCAGFESTVLVLPTQRAARRFMEVLLTSMKAGESVAAGLPEILTPGGLLVKTLDGEDPQLSDASRLLLWKEVLSSERALVAAILQDAPLPASFGEWIALAKALDGLRRELHGNLRTCDDVQQHLKQRGLEEEVLRWNYIAELERVYCRTVAAAGLQDVHTLRNEALSDVHVDCDILYVAGCVELPGVIRALLQQIGPKVEILVADSDEASPQFDELGCVLPVAGARAPSISLDLITVVDRYAEQAAAVSAILASQDGRFHSADIAIACCEEATWGLLEHELLPRGVQARPATGTELRSTELITAVRAMTAYMSDASFEHFAALCRHPALETYLQANFSPEDAESKVDIVTVVDRYHMAHVPVLIQPPLPEVHGDDTNFCRLVRLVEDVLAPFTGAEPQGMAVWNKCLIDVLSRLYPDTLEDAQAELARSSLALSNLLAATEAEQAPDLPLAASEYLQLLMVLIEPLRIPEAGVSDSVDLLGWLELQLDDSPLQIVTDVIEGKLPESLNADLFLPNTLREELGLPCNSRRFARDMYLLRGLLGGNSTVHFVVPRRTARDEYAFPSRFLCQSLSDTDPAELLQLIAGEPARLIEPEIPGERNNRLFVLQAPDQVKQIRSIAVTGLSTYLRCPYEFYLRHIARLDPVHDTSRELDGLLFGSMIHSILDRLYHNGLLKESDPDRLTPAIDELLDLHVRQTFGRGVEPAVLVQIEQARVRLRYFAEVHCARLREGWQVLESEWEWAAASVEVPVRDGVVELRGRIDRIEQHQVTGEIVILDYKTGENVDSPHRAHIKGLKKSPPFEWKDLQLPAYWYALQAHGYPADIGLGYFTLGSDLHSIGVQTVDWNADALSDGVECLEQTVQAIVEQRFWPPARIPQSGHSYARFFLDYDARIEDADDSRA